jgi:hypothetical protein
MAINEVPDEAERERLRREMFDKSVSLIPFMETS